MATAMLLMTRDGVVFSWLFWPLGECAGNATRAIFLFWLTSTAFQLYMDAFLEKDTFGTCSFTSVSPSPNLSEAGAASHYFISSQV
jgi:hypothetical protein